MSSVNIVDIVVCSIVILSVVFGVMRGMVHTVFAISSYLAAFYGTNTLAPKIGPTLAIIIKDKNALSIASYVLVFVFIFLFMRWLNLISAKFIKFIGLTGLDKTMGGFIGLAKGFIISSISIVVFELFFPSASSYIKQAKSTKIMKPIINVMRNNVPKYTSKIMNSSHV